VACKTAAKALFARSPWRRFNLLAATMSPSLPLPACTLPAWHYLLSLLHPTPPPSPGRSQDFLPSSSALLGSPSVLDPSSFLSSNLSSLVLPEAGSSACSHCPSPHAYFACCIVRCTTRGLRLPCFAVLCGSSVFSVAGRSVPCLLGSLTVPVSLLWHACYFLSPASVPSTPSMPFRFIALPSPIKANRIS